MPDIPNAVISRLGTFGHSSFPRLGEILCFPFRQQAVMQFPAKVADVDTGASILSIHKADHERVHAIY